MMGLQPSPRPGLAGRCVLVVEDEPLLAIDYQDELEARGASPVLAMTLTEAITQIDTTAADFAIIDVNLGDELSWPVAAVLTERQIPFVIVSGRCPSDAVPAGLTPLECVPKPIGARILVDRIERLLPS